MSVFSEQLKRCVQESDLSKNWIVDLCQVNRSTFFQCLNGKRLPTEELFETIIQALQLGPGEETKLRKLYYIVQIGESVYQNRQIAQKCLGTLASLSGEVLPQIHRFQGVTRLTTQRAPIQGESQVFQELCHLIQAEMFLPEPKIDLFLPLKNDPFFEYLKLLYRSSEEKVVHLRQMVQFAHRKGETARDSLEFFDSILFFLTSNCSGYEAYYYYTEVDFSDAVGVLYPYSVITSTGVLFLNESMDRALFSTTPEILAACHCQFEDALRKTKQFYRPVQGYEQTLEFLLNHWSDADNEYQYFATPCFGVYLPWEILKQYCPAKLEEAVGRYHASVQSRDSYVGFCSEQGLMRFAQDGIIGEYPAGMAQPLTLEDRKNVLESILYHPPANTKLYLVDEDKMTISDEFVFSLSKGKHIVAYRRALPKVRMFCFTEQSLLETFEDFFDSLPENEGILPQEELERALHEAINCCCEQMLEEESQLCLEELS